MRLKTAVLATAADCPTEVLWWDGAHGTWRWLSSEQEIGTADPAIREPERGPSRIAALKRQVFPSTLWESAQDAVSALPPATAAANLGGSDTVVLHTTYLAPAVADLKRRGARVLIDVHDLVWRAHRFDASSAPVGLTYVRAGYAWSVRRRESRWLREADGLLVCGWRDAELLSRTNAVAWCPVGIPAVESDEPPRDPESAGERPPRIGLIGNFEHSATLMSARALAASPLGDPGSGVELVFAGRASDRAHSFRGRARLVGPVDDVSEFYNQIDAVVLPVLNGSGMKCKLAEAVLANRLVVTNTAGATGYPPTLRQHLLVTSDIEALSASALRAAVRAHRNTTTAARLAYHGSVGLQAAARRTREAIDGRWDLYDQRRRTSAEGAR